MKDIICPNCKTAFQVDESAFAAILSQVRNSEFNEEIERRMAELRQQQETHEETIRLKAEKDFEKRLSEKNNEISNLKAEMAGLNARILNSDKEKKAALADLSSQHSKQLYDSLKSKDDKIAELETRIKEQEANHKINVMEAVRECTAGMVKKDQKIIELQAELKTEKMAAENRVNQLREQHLLQLRDREAEIDRLKDFKLKLSTKMLGETLEQHCAILFSQAQSMGLYPNARFGKDTIALEGTKGDFIFRDFIGDNEYISVMFEMKNEADTTSQKHHNDDFLDKLHKDREKKGCEYAILVSMLEQDNELYNAGIVDKSHRFPKMMVIRPQFFLPVLRLITEAARKSYLEKEDLMDELEVARNETRDFSRFEDKLKRFRDSLHKNVSDAQKKFEAATDGIDKAIEGLEKQIEILRKVKSNFEAAENKLLKADSLSDSDLNVKKLTHGAPSVRKMIEEARDRDSID